MKKLIVTLLALLAVSAFAVVETWEFEAVADTYVVYCGIDGVVQDFSYENFGHSDVLKVHSDYDFGNPHTMNYNEYILLVFDLATLDDSTEYTSFSLTMCITNFNNLFGPTPALGFNTILSPWEEYEVTGATRPSSGGSYHEFPFPTSSGWQTFEFDPSYIYELKNQDSYGIIINNFWMRQHNSCFAHYASRETTNPPKLIVEYDDEASIAPFVADQSPPDGATGVPLSYYSFSFHVYDEHSGVDTTTIDFTVTSSDSKQLSTANETLLVSSTIGNISQRDGKGVITGTLNIDDSDPKDVICNFVLDEDLPADSTITCTVAAGLADNCGNATDTDIVWSYTTAGDSAIEETTWGQIKASY